MRMTNMCEATCLPRAPHPQPGLIWEPALLSVNMLSVSESVLNTAKRYPGEEGTLPTILVRKTYFSTQHLGIKSYPGQVSELLYISILHPSSAENHSTSLLGVLGELMK